MVRAAVEARTNDAETKAEGPPVTQRPFSDTDADRLVDVPDEFKRLTEACDECPDLPGHEECQNVVPSRALPNQFDPDRPQLLYTCLHGHEWLQGTARAE